MAKRDTFLIVDTETTNPTKNSTSKVADFGAVVVTKKGEILAQCAVLVNGIYTDKENHPLFYNNDAGELWTKASLARRYNKYNDMVANGTRMLASVPAINAWLAKVKQTFDPYLTAYNLAFDLNQCANTGIDLTAFADKQFCLWHAASDKYAFTKAYKNYILENHLFNSRTSKGNCSYKTNAEVMRHFICKTDTSEAEPHTALEDVLYWELPILKALVNSTPKKKWLNPKAYNWRGVQLKDHFTAK